MFDIGAVTRSALAPFEVDVTVKRNFAASRTERAVLHPDIEDRAPEDFRNPSLGPLDQIAFALNTLGAYPDIEKGDVVSTTGSGSVESWEIADRASLRDDGFLRLFWGLRCDADHYYNAEVTIACVDGKDDNGDAVFADPFEVSCWVQSAASMLDRIGYEFADASIISTLVREFDTEDRIWLPGDVVETTPKEGRRIRKVWSQWRGGQRIHLAAI